VSKQDRYAEHLVRVVTKRLAKEEKRMQVIQKLMYKKGLGKDILVPLGPMVCCYQRDALVVEHTNMAGGSVVSIGACRRCARDEIEYYKIHNKWPKGLPQPPRCGSMCNKRLIILPFEITSSPCIIMPITSHGDIPRMPRPMRRPLRIERDPR
jgi:hypothetical protein